ncbi:MAG: winged helix-turn-helix domain-containing protein [Xanthomonadales bacterium]|nr:winged helix-turn-helix domain-containing protein [Xanthomonadales bacterium]
MPVPLHAKAFDLLMILVAEPGRLHTRSALIEALWPSTIVEENNLSWNVSAVRKVLDDGAGTEWVETVRGHGYRFSGTVRREPRRPGPDEADAMEGARERAADGATEAVAAAPPAADADLERPMAGRRSRWPALAATLLLAVLAATWFGTREPTPPAASTRAVADNSLAVLPFADLGGSSDGDWFVAGMQATILAKLAAVGDLQVMARDATRDRGADGAAPAEIARALGVAHLLEGSVQRLGDRIRVNVVLVDARTGKHVWGDTYVRGMTDVFDVQNEIAERVAAALRVALTSAERARVAYVPTRNLAAYDDFLRAEYLTDQLARQASADATAAATEARRLYRQAIAADPVFALAWARLSYVESLSGWYYLDNDPATQRSAEQAARTAIALAPDLAQGHLALGYVHYYRDRDYAGALAAFERARALQPGDSDVSVAIAGVLRRQGHLQGAIDAYEQAIGRDPRNPRWHMERGHALMMLRRYDDAVVAYQRSVAADPAQHVARLHEVIAVLMSGDAVRAAALLGALPESPGENRYRYGVAFAIAWLRHDADAAIAALQGAPDWVVSPFLPSTQTPAAYLRGLAFASRSDVTAAADAFAQAARLIEARRRESADDRNLQIVHALVMARSGHATQALVLARDIALRFPLERDAVTAPPLHAALAEIEIQAGDLAGAAERVRGLLERPAGQVVSRARVDADPCFDPIRARIDEP